MNWAGWEARTQDTPGLAQGHLHLAGPRSLLTLTSTILVGKQRLRGAQLIGLEDGKKGGVGEPSPSPETSSQPIH